MPMSLLDYYRLLNPNSSAKGFSINTESVYNQSINLSKKVLMKNTMLMMTFQHVH